MGSYFDSTSFRHAGHETLLDRYDEQTRGFSTPWLSPVARQAQGLENLPTALVHIIVECAESWVDLLFSHASVRFR